ncbi:hypothetical protein ACWEQC_21760 [Streptomyces shenzhenensis]
MEIVVLSGLLGAAILAIVLLAHGWRKNRADINRLHADLTATKIAALTQLTAAPAQEDVPEPSRRKGHLTLYIGGGVAALVTWLGERLRSLGLRGSIATAGGTAVVVAAASTVAALYFTSNDAASKEPGTQLPATASNTPGTDNAANGDDAQPSAQNTVGLTLTSDKDGVQLDGQAQATPSPTTSSAAKNSPRPSAPPETPSQALRDDETEKPAPPAQSEPPAKPTPPTKPEPSAKPEPPAPSEPSAKPTPPPSTQPQPTQPPTSGKPGNGGGLCIGLPPLIELCIGR